MFLYDRKYELDSQFQSPASPVFKTTSSRELTEETFVLNRPDPAPKNIHPLGLGTTFHKEDIKLRLNNLHFNRNFPCKPKANVEPTKKVSMITSSSNSSQIQENIRTSYLLEKYEFTK